MVDAHTIATFAFARLERDSDFHRQYGWVRNTIVCVESDLADDVLQGQLMHYFPEGGTIACYYPEEQRFMFIRAQGRPNDVNSPEEARPGVDVAHDKYRSLTVGMLIDGMYPGRKCWDRLPQIDGEPQFGEISTADVEKKFSLR